MTHPPFNAKHTCCTLPASSAAARRSLLIHTCSAYDSKWMMLIISLLAFCSCDAHALCMTASGRC